MPEEQEWLFVASFDSEYKARFYVKEMSRRFPTREYAVFELDSNGDYSIRQVK